MKPVVTVVVPVYNEEEVLPLFVDRTRPVMDSLATGYEVIFVDDGSTDTSAAVLEGILRQWPEARVVRLRANAGHQAALTAGLAAARGDWVASIDSDLQDPPEVLAEMYKVASTQNVDVVYGVRTDRSTDTFFKRFTAESFYKVMRRFGAKGEHNAGDFRMISRATVDAVLSLPEHGRVFRFVIPALGFPSASVGYRRDTRAAGDSKYPLAKMIKLTLDSMTSVSQAPLRLATWLAGFGFLFAFAIGISAIVAKSLGSPISGWASTICIVAALSALQLLSLGILGEYVGRMYAGQQSGRTYYIAYDSLEGQPGADPRGAGAAQSDPAAHSSPAQSTSLHSTLPQAPDSAAAVGTES